MRLLTHCVLTVDQLYTDCTLCRVTNKLPDLGPSHLLEISWLAKTIDLTHLI